MKLRFGFFRASLRKATTAPILKAAKREIHKTLLISLVKSASEATGSSSNKVIGIGRKLGVRFELVLPIDSRKP